MVGNGGRHGARGSKGVQSVQSAWWEQAQGPLIQWRGPSRPGLVEHTRAQPSRLGIALPAPVTCLLRRGAASRARSARGLRLGREPHTALQGRHQALVLKPCCA